MFTPEDGVTVEPDLTLGGCAVLPQHVVSLKLGFVIMLPAAVMSSRHIVCQCFLSVCGWAACLCSGRGVPAVDQGCGWHGGTGNDDVPYWGVCVVSTARMCMGPFCRCAHPPPVHKHTTLSTTPRTYHDCATFMWRPLANEAVFRNLTGWCSKDPVCAFPSPLHFPDCR